MKQTQDQQVLEWLLTGTPITQYDGNYHMKPAVSRVLLNRSRDNMAKTLHKLQIRLKKTPEDETGLREVLIRKIEMLKIIRSEMKSLIRQL